MIPITPKRFLKFSIILGVIVGAIFYWVFWSDPHRSTVEEFLRKSPEVQEKIGMIKTISLRRMQVSLRPSGVGRAQEPDVKKYFFHVSGEKNSTRIVLEAKISEDDLVGNIVLLSVGG